MTPVWSLPPASRGAGLIAGILTVTLALLAPGAVRAAEIYKIQPIFSTGDKIGTVQTQAKGDIEVNGLNDNGQIAVVTEAVPHGETLLQYVGGKLTPLVIPKADAPSGKWQDGVGIRQSSMNQRGNMLVVADVTVGSKTSLGTFFWDYQAQKMAAVALTGMPAVGGLTFINGGGDLGASLNIYDEMAFTAWVKNAAGVARPGVFFQGQDGKLQAIALPDQALPDGGRIAYALAFSLNDAGVLAFIVRRQGDNGNSAYLWEKGTITPVATVGTSVPGGTLGSVWRVWVNNKNRGVLIAARLTDSSIPTRLLQFADGQLKPMLTPGQDMPDGGKFKRLQSDVPGILRVGADQLGLTNAVSAANDSGQHAVLVRLDDDTTAAYRLDPDGTLTPILRGGATTGLGKITSIGEAGAVGGGGVDSFGIQLNNKGEVALPVRVGTGPATLALLTPSAP